ncbi:hypothetical protein ACFOVU_14280 [Nocardiopsis sediminis]|uniref:Uncharacterized protein n=1 Tax=Nocardiopsis sediminis TaxID=1778267 RepID=A0ABV8FR03_9ACTN
MSGMNAALVLANAEIATDTVTPGVLGFIVVALIGYALYLLMKNMGKHLAAVKERDFDGAGTGTTTAAATGTDTRDE